MEATITLVALNADQGHRMIEFNAWLSLNWHNFLIIVVQISIRVKLRRCIISIVIIGNYFKLLLKITKVGVKRKKIKTKLLVTILTCIVLNFLSTAVKGSETM